MSNPITVKPGVTIQASVELQSDGTYLQTIGVAGKTATSTYSVSAKQQGGETFTDLYFVTEHQPNSCSEYPASGQIIFKEINVAWDGKLQTPNWEAKTFQDACSCKATVVDPATLKFTWSTSD